MFRLDVNYDININIKATVERFFSSILMLNLHKHILLSFVFLHNHNVYQNWVHVSMHDF